MESKIVTPQPVRYVSEKVVSDMTGIPVSTLQKQRHYRKGIAYTKIGKLVRYSVQDVVGYMEACRISPAK